MSLKDCVLKAYDIKDNRSCSESLLAGANEYYGLNLDEKAFLASSAFGGGMYYDGVCGVISSSAAVLGMLYSTGRAHDSEVMKKTVKEVYTKFIDKLGVYTCPELKAKYKTDEKRCETMLATCADVLEEIINENPIINEALVTKKH